VRQRQPAAEPPWWNHIEQPDGLVFRRPTFDDAEGVLSVHGDPRVYEFDPHERHSYVAHSERFLVPMVEHWERHGFGYWTVLVPRQWWRGGVGGPEPPDGDRVHAGLGGLHHHTVAGQPVLNVYFRLAPAIHGRGVAGRIVAAGAQMAAEVAPGIDLVIRTRPANEAAKRVALRSGFVDEGLEPGTADMQLLRLAPE
jgi:ribosomal-protein-alanine N-acetyltransferase